MLASRASALSRPLRPRFVLRALLACVALFGVGAALAQGAEPMPGGAGPVGLQGDDPAALADAAVTAWLDTESIPLADVGTLDAETVCRRLPDLLAAPPPPSGTTVELEDRVERDADADDRRRFTYAARTPAGTLEVVEVVLQDTRAGGTDVAAGVRDPGAGDATAGAWRVERVGFQAPASPGRPWLQGRVAGWAFLLLTGAVVALLVRPSPLRRVLAEGARHVRTHRRVVAITMGGLAAVVVAGFVAGTGLPDACDDAIAIVLTDTLEAVGATSALASGDVVRTAVVIFYQNFGVVTVTLLFGSALLFGVPAYLLAGLSFFAQAAAFGALGLGGGAAGLLAFAVLAGLELSAYFLVVAGGGMLLATLAREGLPALGAGYRKLLTTLPWAALLLLVGAWYEAILLVAAGP
ncbi:MAG: hypothetical protein RI554_08535 [Trueperaceae bacterium]|nr:hypothetical protein [Trueperaceae bacterium]